MRRIIYRSMAARDLDRPEFLRLVYHARMANEREGLSGVLLFADHHFLQVLEGEPSALMATFAAIRSDPRHFAVELLDERSVAAPLFARWRMRSFHDETAADAMAAIMLEAEGAVPAPLADAVMGFFEHRSLPAAPRHRARSA